MKIISFDKDALLGGIVFQDSKWEVVNLKLQPENDLPPHQDSRAMLLIVLAGKVEVKSSTQCHALIQGTMLTIEANEAHQLIICEKDTHLLVVKQMAS